MSDSNLTTRQKLLLIIEGMEKARSIMTISGVAKEARLSNAAIHNRYPDLANRIRESAGVGRLPAFNGVLKSKEKQVWSA